MDKDNDYSHPKQVAIFLCYTFPMQNQEFDFIAIGDIVTDAFIKLKEAEVHCDIKKDTCQICLNFADKVPYESVTVLPAVGNSPNAAVAAARLGLKTALVTNLGADYHGAEAIAKLESEKVATDFVTKHEGAKTNYHYVLWYQDDRTILIKHEKYPYVLPDFALSAGRQGNPQWLYLSSLGEFAFPEYHEKIIEYLESHPEIKVAFQPGTFQIKAGTEKLARLYQRTEVFFCNVEEAEKILKLEIGSEKFEIKKLLEGIKQLGPKLVVITDGPKGAYVYDGNETWFGPTYPDPKSPLERTGAGDAFSATFTATLALGESVLTALACGPINSMSVVQQVGAQAGLLSRAELEKLLATAPEDYKPQKLD